MIITFSAVDCEFSQIYMIFICFSFFSRSIETVALNFIVCPLITIETNCFLEGKLFVLFSRQFDSKTIAIARVKRKSVWRFRDSEPLYCLLVRD